MSIPNTKVDPKEDRLRQVSLYDYLLYFLIIKNVKWIYCQEMNPFVKKKMNISKNYLKITSQTCLKGPSKGTFDNLLQSNLLYISDHLY
jgi:hypothetical protein